MMKLVARNQVIRPRITTYQLETDSMKMVRLLLEKDHSVACWHDDKGLTPLLTAVTMNPCYWLAIEAILQYCPQSAEVCDHFGNNLLHLMTISPSPSPIWFDSDAPMAIKNMQNGQGNTAAHMAVKHHNVHMILLLIELSANFAIKNKDGISAADLIQEQSEDFRNTLKQQGGSHLHWYGRDFPSISTEEKIALCEMDWNSLKKKLTEWGKSFFQKRNEYNNILHIFIKENPTRFGADEFQKFISEVMLNSPSLICEPDLSNKFERNPLHLLVERAPDMINKHILWTIDYHFKAFQREGFIKELRYDPPWKAKDKNGDTPLHLALDPTFWKDEISWFKYIKCAREIIEFDFELAEQVDGNGEMPLHRLVRVRLPEFLTEDETAQKKLWDDIEFIISKSQDALDKPDREGLTPLLRAAKNKDIRFILQVKWYSPGTFNFRDTKGNTHLHLLSDIRLSENEAQYFEVVSLFNLASRIIPERNEDGNTPLHLSIMDNNFELAHNFLNILTVDPYAIDIKKVDTNLTRNFMNLLAAYPNTVDIATLDNNDGNTLLHLVVGKSGSPLALSFIRKVYDSSLEGVLMSNKDGNTALHLAVLNNDFKFTLAIFDMFGSEATCRQILETCNKDQNTPIHLAILEGKSRFIKWFLNIGELFDCNVEILHMRNIRGHTPLHLAIQVGNLDFASQIFDKLELRENFVNEILLSSNEDQNTALHLAILNGESSFAYLFIDKAQEKKCIREILDKPNNQGDSPLHLAIKNRDFELARKFIECAAKASCINEILAIPNTKKETPGRLIGSDSRLPGEFEKFCWNEPKVVEAMLGVRSLSGVSTEIIKDYTNTIGVIAALFATITFTAGFTVPGGLNSNNGTPLLMQKAAFQVFLVSDIIAMCLSMMVLFFLMWIMTINNEKHQVILLDLTVFSLQGAFYATLLTFMTGLYVTVFPTALWIAILSCVLCSLLILLMHKRLIIWFIPGFIHIYVWFQRGYSLIKKLCGHLACCRCNNNKKNGDGSEISGHANKPTGHSQTVVNIQPIN